MSTERPRWLCDWLERHQSRLSFWLHILGIPLTAAALILGAWQLYHDLWEFWWRPIALFLFGYFLQWIGHAHEGNDMGEVIVVKRLIGKPYVAVSPRYAEKRVASASSSAAMSR